MQRFFSIVIPAYNEEKILDLTLEHAVRQTYSNSAYEVIVVENGSRDATLSVARSWEPHGVKVLRSEKGVSRARNLGMRSTNPEMEWCIFLDADTLLPPNFLQQLDYYLTRHPEVRFGTARIYPDKPMLKYSLMYWYTNATDRLLCFMHGVHIVHRDLLREVQYDEELATGEDVYFTNELKKRGKFFFMNGVRVIQSTRRLDRWGIPKKILMDFRSAMPKKWLQKKDWEPIR